MYVIPFVFAAIANIMCFVLGQNYFISNGIVFGSYLIGLILVLDYSAIKSHWKGILGFFTFSTVTTTLLELIFIHTDTWGFSRTMNEMVGVNLFGIPIEEYIFWEFCPLVVIFTYMYFKQLTKPISRLTSSMYVDDVINTDDNGYAKYSRGIKLPVYTAFIAITVFMIYKLKDYGKGNWTAIALTVSVFFLVIFPFEQYALIHHVWVYNMQKMIGIAFLGVPVEEWIVYFACPGAGCLLLEVFNKKLNNAI